MTSAKSLETQGDILRLVQQTFQSRENSTRLETRIDEILANQEGWGSMLVQLLAMLSSTGKASNSGSTRNDLISAVESTQMGIDPESIEISDGRRTVLEKKFISRLDYDGMHDRELHVEEAHAATFHWIFENPQGRAHTWDDYAQWLRSEDRLYWITGKAGAGKSTLMKFISLELPTPTAESSSGPIARGSQRRCTPYLLEWAKEQQLIVATYYFWAGTRDPRKLQTSQNGLYRTLLRQILQASPQAIPHIFPDRWETLCLFNEDRRSLRTTDLRDMLTRAINYVASRAKLCLFIDGLDELDGKTEDLQELVKWLIARTETAPIKICVASRPWPVFENALEEKPNLLLEDLTYDDVKGYVTSTFLADHDFVSLRAKEATFADQLVEDIVLKASGVFLWVNLVCRSLLNGIMGGDRISDLMHRLRELPPELENLYDRILDDLESRYKHHAAQYFFLMLACVRTPDPLLFAFADDIDDEPDLPIRMLDASLPEDDVQHRTKEIRKRLNSRCKGLISVTKPKPSFGAPTILQKASVQYLHRSVKDYMEQESSQRKLHAMLHAAFDPHARLCSASLAMWKVRSRVSLQESRVENSTLSGHVIDSSEKVLDVFLNASQVASSNTSQMMRILEALEQTMSNDEEAFANLTSVLLSRFKDTFPSRPYMGCFGNTFLSLAIKCGVSEFVVQRLDQGCLIKAAKPLAPRRIVQSLRQDSSNAALARRSRWKRVFRMGAEATTTSAKAGGGRSNVTTWPLILDALFSGCYPNLALVSLLLRNGADPNGTTSSGITVFMEVLACAIACGLDPTERSTDALGVWEAIIQQMLQHGASMETRTIDRALRLAAADYGAKPEVHRLTINGLQEVFRAMRWPSTGSRSRPTLWDAQAFGTVNANRHGHYRSWR